MVKYITTDKESALILQKGALYFADFLVDKDAIPNIRQAKLLLENSLIEAFAEREHEINDITVTFPNLPDVFVDASGNLIPPPVGYEQELIPTGSQQEAIRIYFRVNSVSISLLIALMLAAITAIGIGFGSYYLAPALIGVARAVENILISITDTVKETIVMPEKIIEHVSKAPIAIIAILVTIGIFILGRKVIV